MFEDFGVINYSDFIVATIAIVLLPRPNSMYVLSLSGKHGIISGYKAALGIFFGDAIIMLITALGAASILKSNPIIFNIFKFVGGFYLAYLGIQMIITVITSYKVNYKNIQKEEDVNIKTINLNENLKSSNYFRNALYISLINPKAILFFLAFFVQFINPQFDMWKPFIILGFTLQIISFCYLTLIIFIGRYFAFYLKKNAYLKYMGNILVGLLFIFFAYKLCYSNL